MGRECGDRWPGGGGKHKILRLYSDSKARRGCKMSKVGLQNNKVEKKICEVRNETSQHRREETR